MKIPTKIKGGTKSTSSFGEKIMSMDRFGESFTMKFEGGKKELKSITGATLSILLIIVLLSYTGLKVDNLLRRSQIDIISAVNEDFYENTEQIGAKQGFNFAVGLSGFDYDPRIAEFRFTVVDLDVDREASEILRERELESHVCTDEELGIGIRTDKTKLMPLKSNPLEII